MTQHDSEYKISQPATPIAQRCPTFRLARFQRESVKQRTDKEADSRESAHSMSVPTNFVMEDGCEQAEKLGSPGKPGNISHLRAQLKKDLEDSKLMMNVIDKMPTACLAPQKAAGGGSAAARAIKLSQGGSSQMSGGMLRLLAKSKEELSSACSTAPPSFDSLPDIDYVEDDHSARDDSSVEDDESDDEVTPDTSAQARDFRKTDERLKEAELLISVLDKMPSESPTRRESAGGRVPGNLSAAPHATVSQDCSARMSGGMLRSSATSQGQLSEACSLAPPSFDSLPDVAWVDGEDDEDSEDEE